MITQISRIQIRRGLTENLPQPLESAELGWAVDSRQLYIGNGSAAEGSPVPDENTRILTTNDLGNLNASIGSTILSSGGSNAIALTVENNLSPVIIQYSIKRSPNQRTGIMKVANNGTTVTYEDDYTESTDLGITLTPNIELNHTLTLHYSNPGTDANLSINSITFI